MEQLGSFWTNFHEKLKFEHFSKICRKKIKFYQNLTKIKICLSVFMEQLGSFWTNFHEKLKFEHFSKICRKNFKFYQNLTRIRSILHDNQYSFMLISHVILLRVRNASEKCVEKIKIRISYPITYFPTVFPFVR